MRNSDNNTKKPISHLENTMAMLKQLKRSCIVAVAAAVLATTGCHSSHPTTQASAKPHQQLAKAPAANPKPARQTAAAQPKPYSGYWDSMSSEDQVTIEAQTPAPAETEKPAQQTNTQATNSRTNSEEENFELPTYSPAAQPTRQSAPQQTAQAPAPKPAPAQQWVTQAATPAPTPAPAPQAAAPVAKPAPAPQAVAQAPAPTATSSPRQPVAPSVSPVEASTVAPTYADETSAKQSEAEISETETLMHTQEVNGARSEATLYPDQFDGPSLTSLGTHALDLMLQSSRSCNPLVLYLDIPDDNLAEERRLTIGRYLEDRGGLKPEQIEFHYGTNPANYHAADTQLGYYLVKTDTGSDGYGATATTGAGASH